MIGKVCLNKRGTIVEHSRSERADIIAKGYRLDATAVAKSAVTYMDNGIPVDLCGNDYYRCSTFIFCYGHLTLVFVNGVFKAVGGGKGILRTGAKGDGTDDHNDRKYCRKQSFCSFHDNRSFL